MASAKFLSEFSPVSTVEWDHAIRKSLDGTKDPEKLIWHPEEGLSVRPCYRAEDLKDLTFLEAGPGEFPYVRGTRTVGDWRIREEIDAADPEEANRFAVEAIGAGADEIAFNGAAISNQATMAQLLANFKGTSVRFHGLDPQSVPIVAEWFRAHPHGGHVSADIDALAAPRYSAELSSALPGSRLLTISAEQYEEEGLGAIEQLAFTLSAGVEFVDAMLELGVSITRATEAIIFSFAIGPRFFIEIAKLRAFRLVWARAVDGFGGNAESAKAVIYARTAHWNETIYDPQVNTLRATTEAMSAIVGGADSIAVTPFDECYRKPDGASRRLARNVQVVLKREANLMRVADPLGGAYAIEALTDSIATQAWHMFQAIEAAGGYCKAKADGMIERIIERRSADRDHSSSHRRLALTGTNRHALSSERALDRVECFQPHRNARVARKFEVMRLNTERAALKGKLPRIILAEFGNAKMRETRAQFAADFLACAGLGAEIRVFDSPAAMSEANADLIVLCSSDAEYLEFACELMPLLNGHECVPQIAVAGNPESAEDLKRIGVADFIHLGSNAVEVLTRLQQKLGIEG